MNNKLLQFHIDKKKTRLHVQKQFDFIQYSNESNLKRNFLFLQEFKFFSKHLFFFIKTLKKHFFTANKLTLFSHLLNIKTFKPYILFIADKKDFFFFNLFELFISKYHNISFLLEWNVSRFFYFFNKKKSLCSNFFPIMVISPYLYYDKNFMSILQFLYIYPIFFFIEKTDTLHLNKFYFFKNIFPIFLCKKNNLKFLLTFFKFFTKFL